MPITILIEVKFVIVNPSTEIGFIGSIANKLGHVIPLKSIYHAVFITIHPIIQSSINTVPTDLGLR